MAVPNRQLVPRKDWFSYHECIDMLHISKSDMEIIEEIENRMLADGRSGTAIPRILLVKKFSRESMYAIQTCAKTISVLGNTSRGSRNDKLNERAFVLGRIMARSWTHHRRMLIALWKGSLANGLVNDDGPESVIRTIISGLVAGYQDPMPDLEDWEPKS